MRIRVIIPAGTMGTLMRYFFLAVAIICLGLFGFALAERVLYQTRESRAFDRARKRDAAGPAVAPRPAPVEIRRRSRLRPASRPTLALPGELIGRLSVPRLQMAAMVREGVDQTTLGLAIGHIPQTPLPGQTGNVGVAGHRDTFFRDLQNLHSGDKIQFVTADADFEYEVESLMVVEPANVAVLATSADNVLTLVTCYPFTYVGTAPKRFVVRARQVSPPAVAWSAVK
jgi:sortase A